MNREFPDVQAGFRKSRGTRVQIANICWITEKAREFQRNIYLCFIDYAKAFDCVDHNKLWKILKRDGNITRPSYLSPEKPIWVLLRCLLTPASALGSEHMRFCLHSKNEVSVSCIFLECKYHWLSNSNFLRIRFPGAGSLGWGSQYGAWTPHSSVRTSALMISHLFVRLTWECESWLYRTSSPPTCGSFFLSLSWENVFHAPAGHFHR